MDLTEAQLSSIFTRIADAIPAKAEMGGTLDVPHPMMDRETFETVLTSWVRSKDVLDFDDPPKPVNGLHYTVEERTYPYQGFNSVVGAIAVIERRDEYGEVTGKPAYVLKHKYEHPKRKDKSVCATALSPRGMAGERDANGHYSTLPLRKRFPDAFAQFEAWLKREGKPSPIGLLDNVPPEVIETLIVMGVESIEDFASLPEDKLFKLRSKLEAANYTQRAVNVENYRERAREYAGVESPKRVAKKAA